MSATVTERPWHVAANGTVPANIPGQYFDADSIGEYLPELTARRQWCVWRYEPTIDKNGERKKMKVPYCGFAPRRKAKSNDPQTWCTFEQAVKACERDKTLAGIGFMLAADDPYVAVDLDYCLNERGMPSDDAVSITALLDTYTERTPSGKGLRLFVKAALPPGGRKRGPVEVYDRLRYVTITGLHWHGTPQRIERRQAELEAFHARYFAPKEPPPPSVNGKYHPSVAIGRAVLDDDELIRKAAAARNGALFDALFSRGDLSHHGNDHSGADLALCDLLAFWSNGDMAQMDRIFRRSKLYRAKWDHVHHADGSSYGQETLRKAVAGKTEFYSPPLPVDVAAEPPRQAQDQVRESEEAPARPLPVINAAEKDLQVISGHAWRAIQDANAPPFLFRHGGIVVRLEQDDLGAPLIRELTPERLRHALARMARWTRTFHKKDGTFAAVPALPPAYVVADVLATPDLPLPVLARIVEAPVFAPDGSLQQERGYHPAGRTYYHPSDDLDIPSVPLRPTAADVERAKRLVLHDLLGDFPFVSADERANAVALFLLPFVRDLIAGPTPLHLIEAPLPGSGKSLLADVLTRPAAGRGISAMTEARDDAEWKKTITTVLREARAVVLIDNLHQALDSAALSAALTADMWEDRLLGRNDLVRVPVRCAWIATGNNPLMSTELARRCVRIRLDPKVDRPWNRSEFRHPDLREWVNRHRGELIWAALTMVCKWQHDGGKPAQRLGSYERWSEVVGGVLASAGIDGFLGNSQDFYDKADMEGALWRQFVILWWHKHGERTVGTAELFDLAQQLDFDLGRGNERSQRTAFGKRLAAQRDRVVGDYRIIEAGEVQRARRWALQVGTAPTVPQ